MPEHLRLRVEELLEGSGVVLDGPNPWDPQVRDERLFSRLFSEGTLGFGESYMDGWWDCDQLDEMVARLLKRDITKKLPFHFALIKDVVFSRLMNRQSSKRAFHIGEAHYDIGNDLYEVMLGTYMAYTCGYWKDASSHDEAQRAKLDLVCRKIGLQKGDRVLDIGCGWGSFAKFAATEYGAEVVGITVSKEQAHLAESRCQGLPVQILIQDYRLIEGTFDHIISLGMFEHVGPKNYRTYFEVAQKHLREDGLFLLHTIGGNTSANTTDPWIERYIFPNSVIPSAKQITQGIESLFVLEDWHNFGTDYDKTLLAWNANVEVAWPTLKDRYDERFGRMWRYYLLACAGTFRARYNNLWQIVLSPSGVEGGYTSIR